MVRIAVAQTPGSRLDEWPKVHELIEELIQRATDSNADLVLFPECVWPAYFIGSVDDYFQARDAGMPSDRWFLTQLTTWTRAHRIAICAGFIAEQERRLFNAACLISEAGQVLGTYHKCFLWDFDHAFFEPGRSIAPVSTAWGPVGLMICADARLPEIAATLAARGARLILHPTAWVNCGTPERLWNPQPELLVPERAREFGLPIASASKWGVEGETTFVGSSLICDAAGTDVAHCGTSETNLIIADVTLRAPQRPKLTASQRARLLGSQPAEPPTANVPSLRVVLLKQHAAARVALNTLGKADPSDGAAPTLLLAHPPTSDSPPDSVDRRDNWLFLTGPVDGIQALDAARVAAVRDRDATGFAPLRALALDGVHLVVVFGDAVSARTLRSRAAENRVFLVHVTASGISGYDPCGDQVRLSEPCDGTLTGTSAEVVGLALDIARAADKEFAPRTNPFAQRRPELYEF
ncbi:MAG: carbon-nitrogen hydrolase family protein [Phycisphaerae bacterium]